jgi:hypothetical protein
MSREGRNIASRALSRCRNPFDRLLIPRASQPPTQRRFFLIGSQDRGLTPRIANFHWELLTKSPRLCLDETPIFINAHWKPILMNHPAKIHPREVKIGLGSPPL